MRRFAVTWVALLAGCMFGCPLEAKHGGPVNAGAQEVFREMMNSYETLPSFEQSGVARTVVKQDDKHPTASETRFHMTYVRPDALQFEYGDHVALNARGRSVADGQGTAYGSIDEAIQALSKASLGVSRLVPSMLLGRGNYPWPEELWTALKWVRVEEVRGEACDVLAVELGDGGEWTLWVDQARHLLRKTHKSGHLDDGVVEATVEYEPAHE